MKTKIRQNNQISKLDYLPAQAGWNLIIGYSKQFITICLIIGIWLLIITRVPSAQAQSATLTLSPPVVEILLSPNHKVSQTFTLSAEGSPLVLTPTLRLAKPNGTDGHVTIDPSPLNESTIPLVITSSHPLNEPIMSDGPVTLTLTFEGASLDVPQDIYLALVLSASSTDSPLTRPNLGVGGGISSLILLTLTPVGTLPVSLEIEGFSPPVVHDSWTPLTLAPTLKNGAPIMVRPEGTFEIIGPGGTTIISLPLYPNLILGDSSRSILASSKDPSFAQQGTVLQALPLSWSPKWSDLGPHRLRLTITTQGGTKLTEVEKVVWILPLRIIAFCTVLIFVALTWFIKTKKLRQSN